MGNKLGLTCRRATHSASSMSSWLGLSGAIWVCLMGALLVFMGTRATHCLDIFARPARPLVSSIHAHPPQATLSTSTRGLLSLALTGSYIGSLPNDAAMPPGLRNAPFVAHHLPAPTPGTTSPAYLAGPLDDSLRSADAVDNRPGRLVHSRPIGGC